MMLLLYLTLASLYLRHTKRLLLQALARIEAISVVQESRDFAPNMRVIDSTSLIEILIAVLIAFCETWLLFFNFCQVDQAGPGWKIEPDRVIEIRGKLLRVYLLNMQNTARVHCCLTLHCCSPSLFYVCIVFPRSMNASIFATAALCT
jgi:hypothetical protein